MTFNSFTLPFDVLDESDSFDRYMVRLFPLETGGVDISRHWAFP